MIGPPFDVRVWLACGRTDMRKARPREGAGMDGQGLCLFVRRLKRCDFVWPMTATGRVSLRPAQLSMLLEGIDWRMPQRVNHPELAG
jgi:transposase